MSPSARARLAFGARGRVQALARGKLVRRLPLAQCIVPPTPHADSTLPLLRRSQAAPHAAVPPESFYKHIDGDLPPAVQMRHLLVFLGKRVGPPSTLAAPSAAPTAATVADAKGKGKLTTADEGSRTAKGAAIADEIIEETLRQIMRAKVDTNPSSSSGVHVSRSGVKGGGMGLTRG